MKYQVLLVDKTNNEILTRLDLKSEKIYDFKNNKLLLQEFPHQFRIFFDECTRFFPELVSSEKFKSVDMYKFLVSKVADGEQFTLDLEDKIIAPAFFRDIIRLNIKAKVMTKVGMFVLGKKVTHV